MGEWIFIGVKSHAAGMSGFLLLALFLPSNVALASLEEPSYL